MYLMIVQHGEALTKEVDPARPLSEKGRKEVQHIADLMASAPVTVERVWHSGKDRAHQTAELLGAAMAPGREPEAVSGLAPNDPVAPMAQEIARWSEDSLVVGHLPFVGRLVSYLVAGQEELALVTYQPGSVVCLEQGDGRDWAIAWMLRPDLLPERAG